MTDLLELAARVEGLTGPDREVDALVWLHLPEQAGHAWKHDGNKKAHARQIAGVPFVPVYTASVDHALKLVPNGAWAEGSLGSHVDRRSSLEIHKPCTYDPIGRATAATPALALVSACLRARAHGGGEG